METNFWDFLEFEKTEILEIWKIEFLWWVFKISKFYDKTKNTKSYN